MYDDETARKLTLVALEVKYARATRAKAYGETFRLRASKGNISVNMNNHTALCAYSPCLRVEQAGYRNFFASVLAGNQRGFARAVQESGLPRRELFICGSVVSNRAGSYEAAYAATKRGCEQNLGAFSAGGVGYLDQIMLDYPGPTDDAVNF